MPKVLGTQHSWQGCIFSIEFSHVFSSHLLLQAKQLITENGLNLSSLEIHPRCNVAIDGADEADSHLTLIKGGGGCLAQEKIVAQFSDQFVVIADERKNSSQLGSSFKYVPIEVLPLAYKPLQEAIKVRRKKHVVAHNIFIFGTNAGCCELSPSHLS